MRFGLALPQYEYSFAAAGGLRWAAVVEWAIRAEQLGFNSVWLSDHLFYDLARYGGPEGRQKGVECFTGLAALAVATSRVRLGSLVACNDLRSPAVLAKTAATLDVLSGGRLDLGMGAGWFQAEYRAAGIPFDPPAVRVERLGEALQIIRRLLHEGRLSFEGRHYRLDDVRCLPGPVQPRLPVFVGGHGDRMARLAGRYADGFNSSWACHPEEFAARTAVVNRAAERAGRSPEAIAKTVGLYTLPGRTGAALGQRWQRYAGGSPAGRPELRSFPLWAEDKLVGTHRELVERIQRFEALGVDEIILTFGTIPFQICDPDAVTEFMEEVAPLVG
ncbi:LLM class flavin-dependent oxidoreductase [soil metagenome]